MLKKFPQHASSGLKGFSKFGNMLVECKSFHSSSQYLSYVLDRQRDGVRGQGTRARASSVFVSPNQIWDMLEEAREANVSLQAVARLRSKELLAGASDTSVHFWSNKVLNLYFGQNKLVFLNLPHLCLVTDASTHSQRDILVSVVYNHEKDVCGLAPSQQVSRSKVVSPLDFDLADDVQALAAERKVERLAAYKFLAALSNQVSEITQGRQDLSSYFCAEAMQLSPPGQNQKRFLSRGNIVIKNEETNESVTADFSQAPTTPILSVCIDQGAIGAVPGVEALVPSDCL